MTAGSGETPRSADGRSRQLYVNRLPDLLPAELAQAARVGAVPAVPGSLQFVQALQSGRIKWAVTEAEQLSVVPKWVGGVEISHAVLVGGQPVLAAGEADVAVGGGRLFGIEITSHSGHYQPDLESVEIGRAAFAAIGVDFP